jgi:hypothetical protein
MMELVLIKAVVELREVLQIRLLPRADVAALIAVSSVCFEWWQVITCRKRNRQILRQLFRRRVRFVQTVTMFSVIFAYLKLRYFASVFLKIYILWKGLAYFS